MKVYPFCSKEGKGELVFVGQQRRGRSCLAPRGGVVGPFGNRLTTLQSVDRKRGPCTGGDACLLEGLLSARVAGREGYFGM